MKTQSHHRFLLSLALAVGCIALAPVTMHAQSVRANWRLNAPFNDYKTYEWIPSNDEDHPFYRQYVDEYVNYALTKKKGLRQVTAEQSPDLLVQYHFLTQETVDTNTTYMGMGDGGWGGWGWGGWGWGGMGMGMGGMGWATTTQQPRTMGILTLDLIDARTHQLVWRGQASEDNIVTGGKGEEKQVAMSIFKMLDRYPPTKK
jgi:hypothetical protein